MEQTKNSMLINKKVTTNNFIIYTMHTKSTMTDILQKVFIPCSERVKFRKSVESTVIRPVCCK